MRLHDFLDYWARERPRSEFAVAGDRTLSYAEAAATANRLASRLVAARGGEGSRLAVVAKNAPWYAVLYFAAAKAGVVVVPVNWRLAQSEWVRILCDAQPSVLIAGDDCVPAVDEIRHELGFVGRFVADGPAPRRTWEALERWQSDGPATPPDVEVSDADALYQMYTSGTTGAPKGAVLSHRAVTANVAQVSLVLPVGAGDRGLVVLPMFHASIIPTVFAVVCRGGAVVMETFEPERVVRVL